MENVGGSEFLGCERSNIDDSEFRGSKRGNGGGLKCSQRANVHESWDSKWKRRWFGSFSVSNVETLTQSVAALDVKTLVV